MQGYADTVVFNAADKGILALAQQVVTALPNPPEGAEPWRCHEVARAVAEVMTAQTTGLRVVDGKYGSVQHTWLAYRSPRGLRILDVYCVGQLPQVVLVDATWRLGHSYTPDHLPRLDIDLNIVAQLANDARRTLGAA